LISPLTEHTIRDHRTFTDTILRQVRTFPAALAAAKRQHDQEQEAAHQRTLDECSGWRRTLATPSPPNELHKKIKFDAEAFRRSHFKLKGQPSTLNLLPYLDKIHAATFDPMHLVLIGLMKTFCKDVYIDGQYGGTENRIAKPKKVTKKDKTRAEATQQQMLDNTLGLSVTTPSESDLANLRRMLETEKDRNDQDDNVRRKELYTIFRSEDVHELTRLMDEVSDRVLPVLLHADVYASLYQRWLSLRTGEG
jgi:hypothetical protein